MRWTQTLIPTLRQVPTEAVVPSHQMMLRAGLIQQVAAGSYTYLPLGWRVLHKVMNIVREEMDRAGAAEVLMPALQPLELWEQTGRDVAYGENLFVVKDRHGRKQALGPTHEEVVTYLVKTYVSSYRQLPLNLYQIQTKFRDEFRPRYGVLRSREFQMKDAYSFHIEMDGPAGLNAEYENMREAYRRIFTRCGVDFVEVEAEAGPIGGDASHEFMVLTPTGEDTILSNGAGYAANMEKCEIGTIMPTLDGDPTGELQAVETPNTTSIDDLCARWKQFTGSGKLKPENTLKTLIYRVDFEFPADIPPTHHSRQGQHDWVLWVCVVRGDREVNEAKLRRVIEKRHKHGSWEDIDVRIELIDLEEGKRLGLPIGYVGPDIVFEIQNEDTRTRINTVADQEIVKNGFWVTGANRDGVHNRHFDWWRDFFKRYTGNSVEDSSTLRGSIANLVLTTRNVRIEDIRNAAEGDPAPESRGGGTLTASKGIEVGHVFKLGSKYSNALGLTVTDEKQAEREVIMGCYGIGVNRIIASAIESERGHDDGGIVWPMAIAPFHVVITPIKYEDAMHDVANKLYAELATHGVDVLLDDRDERPGVKFKDADLIGIPVRITVGNKGLELDTPSVEYKLRHAAEAEMVPVNDVVARVVELVRAP
ncbi:MAG: proline--tRNA ligase [Phycisphaera sp.]|nr:proline--tRNA ligase [Phycisphaera sp.]